MAKDTVTREDARGNKIEVEVGADGKTPVSVNNPVSDKAYLKTPTWDYTPGETVEEDSDAAPKSSAKKTASSKPKK